MKLHFEADLPYQAAAIEAVCDLFRGQEVCRSEFTVTMRAAGTAGDAEPNALQATLEGMQQTEQGGIGNRLTLLDDEITDNLKTIQLRNGLPPTTKLSGDFTVEMETGTGKTYVYLRTVFELNKRYGFTKFVIVVPSVAIKEGVNKTLEITRDHLRACTPGPRATSSSSTTRPSWARCATSPPAPMCRSWSSPSAPSTSSATKTRRLPKSRTSHGGARSPRT